MVDKTGGILTALVTVGLVVGSIKYEWFIWVWAGLFVYFLITLPDPR
jgi:hypothetical protein